MPGMKISLDAAMRARDVSQPTAGDEAAADKLAEPTARAQPAGRGRPPEVPGGGGGTWPRRVSRTRPTRPAPPPRPPRDDPPG
ncbi:MAG TPA: hypothetical protein VEJ42_07180 [Streptosporangiaceae bacterium]|nr:hypothetical protein [Streptosporangiaceae bacterium]